ncbi:hypothetical protein R1flu_012777 [Riccia fluitans]|uniref:Uncharacterized protein n=1 Tax=Riccia fluitans TaxID=41844 RepID=A0ABD1ZBS0_9MARC
MQKAAAEKGENSAGVRVTSGAQGSADPGGSQGAVTRKGKPGASSMHGLRHRIWAPWMLPNVSWWEILGADPRIWAAKRGQRILVGSITGPSKNLESRSEYPHTLSGMKLGSGLGNKLSPELTSCLLLNVRRFPYLKMGSLVSQNKGGQKSFNVTG